MENLVPSRTCSHTVVLHASRADQRAAATDKGRLAHVVQLQQQAQKDLASGALNEQTVNAYFQVHLQKASFPLSCCAHAVRAHAARIIVTDAELNQSSLQPCDSMQCS
jgi:hypothetical protein